MDEEYGIATNIEIREELNEMCNLSDAIEEKGIAKGIKALIETCQELGMSEADTLAKGSAKFEISVDKMGKFMKLYWKHDNQ